MKKALLCFFMFVFVVYFVTIGTAFLWKLITGDGGSVYIAITSSAIYSIILLALFIRKRWAVLSPAWFRTADKSVLFWAGVAAIGTILPFELIGEQFPALDEDTATMLTRIAQAPLGYITLCLLAPFVEEIVFRGAVLRSLLNAEAKPWAAITISAVLFAIAHGSLAQCPHAFITGILLGWMFFRTGSILPGVAFHWANNTAVYAVIALAPQTESMTLAQVFGGSARAAMAIGCSLCILLPALWQLNSTMRK